MPQHDPKQIKQAGATEGQGLKSIDGKWQPSFDPASVAAQERQGLPNRTDSAISRTDSGPDRTFTIQPSGPPAEYDLFVLNQKYTKTGALTKVWPDTKGIHFFYFDDAGVLQTTMTFTADLVEKYAIVALLYWNSTIGASILFADERHGLAMSGRTHRYLHQTVGAVWDSGLLITLAAAADSSGDNNTSAQFGMADGVIWDEDIRFAITDGSPQDISPTAQVPILYHLGADGEWYKEAADGYPLLYDGKPSGYTDGRIPYNEWTGSTWQLTEVTNNDFMLMHYFATNDVDNPIIGIVGQEEYGNVSSARAGAEAELLNLLFGSLPTPEMVPVATVIFQTSDGYANVPQARIRSTGDGDDFIDWRGSKVTAAGGSALELHGSTHKALGPDEILLDEFGTPTDNTNLDATTSLHGLLPKLGGGTTNFLRADGTWAAAGAGGGATIASTWTFDNATGTPPGDKEFRYNNGTMASVTNIYFDDNSESGIDMGNLLSRLQENDTIYVQNQETGTQAQLWKVTGDAVDSSGYWTIPVTLIDAATDITDGKKCSVILLFSGGVNTSGTPVDNDFAKFTDADTIEGRSYAETRDDLNISTVNPGTNGFRATPTENTPVITGNVVGATDVYMEPYTGNRMSVYDTSASKWVERESAGFSYAQTGRTTDLPYDGWAYWTGSALAIEVENWTNATTRATDWEWKDGVRVQVGDNSRRLVFSVRPRSATTYHMRMLSDGDANPVQIDLANVDNGVRHNFGLYDDGSSFNYSSSIRQWRADTGYQVEIMNALEEEILEGAVNYYTYCTGFYDRSSAIGYDSTSTYVGHTTGEQGIGAVYGTTAVNGWSHLRHRPGIGRHFYSWNQMAAGATTTWYSYVAGQYRVGFTGSWVC